MSKPVYMDFAGSRTQIAEVPDDYQIGTTAEVAALFRKHVGFLHVESVTQDADGIYLRMQMIVARAVASPRFWWSVVKDIARRVRDWKIG